MKKCNCQYEQGHGLTCPLYKERSFKEAMKELKASDIEDMALKSVFEEAMNGADELNVSSIIEPKQFYIFSCITDTPDLINTSKCNLLDSREIRKIKPNENLNAYLYNKIDKIIGGGYYFDSMCSWAKEEGGVICHHYDCIKAFEINRTNKFIRDEIKELLK